MRDGDKQDLERLSSEPFFPVQIYDGDTHTNAWIHVPDVIKSESCRAYHVVEDTGCAEVPSGTYIVVDSSESPGNNDLVYAKIGDKTSVYRFIRGGMEDFLSVDDSRVPLISVKSSEIKGVIVFLSCGD
jgi:SOS-response transcriptional repressor LexA